MSSGVPGRQKALVVHPSAELFGADRMALESVIGLRDRGVHVVVALPADGPLVDELMAAGADVVIVPMLVLRKALLTPRGFPKLLVDAARGWASAWRLVSRAQPDVVYVSTITIPQWPVLARLRGRRVVSHVHEAEASGRRWINRMMYLPHLASHLTLVNSAFSLGTIGTALPVLARRARVVHNGVATPETPSPPRAQLDGPLRVLYVGRLSPRKGPDLVIAAADALARRGTPVTVTVLGSAFTGYEWFEEELRAQAAEAAVDVEFAGFRPDVWPYLAEADVLVTPSRVDEPFGNTAVEGVLARRPVIASDGSGLREAAGGYASTRLVAPDDSEAIAAALRDIVASWPAIAGTTAADRAEAVRRHAPAVYRRTVASAVLPPSDVAVRSTRSERRNARTLEGV